MHEYRASTILEVRKVTKCFFIISGVPDSMQKLMYKGLLQDNQTIASSGITKGSKIMLVGSTLNDVLAVSSVSKEVRSGTVAMTLTKSTRSVLCRIFT